MSGFDREKNRREPQVLGRTLELLLQVDDDLLKDLFEASGPVLSEAAQFALDARDVVAGALQELDVY